MQINSSQYTSTQKLCSYVAGYDSPSYALLLSGCFGALAFYAQRYQVTFTTAGYCLAFGSITAFNTALMYGAKKHSQQCVKSSITAQQDQLHSTIAQVKLPLTQISDNLEKLPSFAEEIAHEAAENESDTLLVVSPLPWTEWKQQVQAVAQTDLKYAPQQIKQKASEWLKQWQGINSLRKSSSYHSLESSSTFEIALQISNSQERDEQKLGEALTTLISSAKKVTSEIQNKNFSDEQIKILDALITGISPSPIELETLQLSNECLESIKAYQRAKSRCINSLLSLKEHLSEYLEFQAYKNLKQDPIPRSAITIKMACTAIMSIVVWQGAMGLRIPVWPPSQWGFWHSIMAFHILQVLLMSDV
jgi:hypothetical protein